MSESKSRRHRVFPVIIMVVLGMVVAGCGGIPRESAPQPITSFARERPTDSVPEPESDLDPEALVRGFLKAAASPSDAHAAARKFLTPASAARWDERGDSIILDDINTYVDQRSEDAVRMRLVGDNVGVLHPNGQLLPASGQVETTITLTRVNNQWRIDGTLPDRTMIDSDQFKLSYHPVSVYFADRNRENLVPDPRWMYFGRDTDPTALVTTLIDGPASDLAPGVSSALPAGAALRGPVTPAPDGGLRIDLTGIGDHSVPDRTLLAAQIIWTLNGAEIGGPYVINADGAPLVADRAGGWQTTDVYSFDPNVAPAAEPGLNIIRDGALLKVIDTGTVPVPGALGSGRSVRSASISTDGKQVATVRVADGDPSRRNLDVGDYGHDPTTITSGTSITRPSWGPGTDVWAVVDGRPVEWVRDSSGGTRISDVDAGQVQTIVRGTITELQVAPDGVRVAMIVDGQVLLAVLATGVDGRRTLAQPRIAAYNIGDRAVSLDWASPTTVVVARDASDSPVVQLSINGTPATGLLSGNVSPPVTAVVANPTTVYLADRRGVLRLGSTNGNADEYWTEVEPAMAPGTIPVLN